MDSDSQGLDIIASVGPSGEVRQVKLNLVPAFVQPHGHSTDKGFDASGRLIVRCSETSAHVFIVEDLDFEGEIFFELSEGKVHF